jgi:hypothetical protein
LGRHAQLARRAQLAGRPGWRSPRSASDDGFAGEWASQDDGGDAGAGGESFEIHLGRIARDGIPAGDIGRAMEVIVEGRPGMVGSQRCCPQSERAKRAGRIVRARPGSTCRRYERGPASLRQRSLPAERRPHLRPSQALLGPAGAPADPSVLACPAARVGAPWLPGNASSWRHRRRAMRD